MLVVNLYKVNKRKVKSLCLPISDRKGINIIESKTYAPYCLESSLSTEGVFNLCREITTSTEKTSVLLYSMLAEHKLFYCDCLLNKTN